MHIIKKIAERSQNPRKERIPTIAFLGDSVTQGCFEVYTTSQGTVETIYDKKNAYHQYVFQVFTHLFPNVPINIINAGISGDTADQAVERLQRDVLDYKPDLTVVCFGLNDSAAGLDGIERYKKSLDIIFKQLNRNSSEIIYMTANMMNTRLNDQIHDERLKAIAINCMQRQNDGILKAYFDAGKKIARENGVKICDVYAKWEAMHKQGVDITGLLANNINHPKRELNWLFTAELINVMFSTKADD